MEKCRGQEPLALAGTKAAESARLGQEKTLAIELLRGMYL